MGQVTEVWLTCYLSVYSQTITQTNADYLSTGHLSETNISKITNKLTFFFQLSAFANVAGGSVQ